MTQGAARVETGTSGRRERDTRRAFLIGCAALSLVVNSVIGQDKNLEPAKTYAEDFHPALKGSADKVSELRIYGPEAGECVKFEPEGLRIRLPVGYPRPRPGTGVVTDFGIKGDFEITLSFEILSEPTTNVGPQRELRLVVVPDEPTLPEVWHKANQNRASLARICGGRNHAGPFFADVTKWNDEIPKDKWGNELFHKVETHRTHAWAAKEKSGRLRLLRQGPMLFFHTSDGDKNLRFFFEQEFGVKDLKNVRVLASTGGAAASFDVRITDLHIRADSFVRPIVPATAMPPDAGPDWLAIAAGGFAAVLLLLVVWFYVRKRRGAAQGQADISTANHEPATLVFRCPQCGKSLKAKAELAGKKLRCPKCNNAVHIPKDQTGELKEMSS